MILLYRGKSWTSRLIEWFNWSRYSHASWTFATSNYESLMGDLTEWEAYTHGGVEHVKLVGHNHTLGTRVDLYELIKPLNNSDIALGTRFLEDQLGKGYDWRGVFHFLTRNKKNNPDRWFCSELVFTLLCTMGRSILHRIMGCQVYPGQIATSTEIRPVGYIVLGGGFRVHKWDEAALPCGRRRLKHKWDE